VKKITCLVFFSALLFSPVIHSALDVKKDPFQKPFTTKLIKPSLTSLGLSSFRLKGLIAGQRALIESQDVGFVIQVGSIVGYEKASVVGIGENYVILKMSVQTEEGKFKVTTWKWHL